MKLISVEISEQYGNCEFYLQNIQLHHPYDQAESDVGQQTLLPEPGGVHLGAENSCHCIEAV